MSKAKKTDEELTTTGAEAPTESKSSKQQTLMLVGIGLILLGVIFIIIALYQPKVSNVSSVTVSVPSADTVAESGDAAQYEYVADTDTETIAETETAAAETQYTTASGSASTTAAAATETYTVYSATTTPGTTAAATTAAATTTTAATTTSVSYPLNLNTCTQAELETLDSIGEARAYAIISYREYLGGYTSTEQIMEIKGIGEGIYEKIKDYITV